MLKNLKYLFKLRAWLKSGTLKAGGLITLLGGLEAFVRSADGMDLLAEIAKLAGLSTGTLSGVVLGVSGLVTLLYRARTERSLAQHVADSEAGK